jgi:hypothetical protein
MEVDATEGIDPPDPADLTVQKGVPEPEGEGEIAQELP